ncbi:hypothetical protein PPL_09518 [Heterostelium album PN500]|uniref:Uncharacterized protein n=1 Tax=Heterostelium pallidum (strain ATCC 26659 / Pp 5 / PN500) TaxID=670386 RepID=D3BNA7_HETP5|nr:hypothetical protein PPL_09518 [Heterostelium album PN500]EFA76767.1 hypothetical protein PPL_09518 [Heterostelium album PN500]|eukprot:XP_020428899.1 hypothetical protein PPL_09518 [Heterostelium album PN500]
MTLINSLSKLGQFNHSKSKSIQNAIVASQNSMVSYGQGQISLEHLIEIKLHLNLFGLSLDICISLF